MCDSFGNTIHTLKKEPTQSNFSLQGTTGTYCVWHLDRVNVPLKVIVIGLHADDVIDDLIHLFLKKRQQRRVSCITYHKFTHSTLSQKLLSAYNLDILSEAPENWRPSMSAHLQTHKLLNVIEARRKDVFAPQHTWRKAVKNCRGWRRVGQSLHSSKASHLQFPCLLLLLLQSHNGAFKVQWKPLSVVAS